jgi:KDO2-lipid IV(A) lauroyltransferase
MADETRAPDSGVRYSPHRRIESAGLRRLARRTRERGVIGGYRAAESALGRISPRVSSPVARRLFVGGYYGWPQKRRIVKANAAQVLGKKLGDPAVARLARRIYASYAEFALELMRLPSRPVDEPLTLVHSAPEHGIDSFVDLWKEHEARGKGVIAVSGHIGSIELFAAAGALRGMPTYGLADDTEYPELFARLTEMRARRGVRIIPWKNLRDVFRALREPAVLGLVVDWGYRPSDVPVTLFGAWTTLPAGPATLAAKTGASIVPVVNRRRADGTYLASHMEPITVADSSPAEIRRATQQIADALERMVRVQPEQWFTFKPMWPNRIEEADELERRAQEMDAG